VYCKDETSDLFKQYVHEQYSSRNNLNINLLRGKYYDPKGRNQTLEEAKQLDKEITDVVESKYGFDLIIPGELEYSEKVLTFVVDKYKQLIQN
jgi:aspartate/tyrosine/aromatic aminotransferase